MALTNITPVRAHVRWDHVARRPARIRWAGLDVGVVGLSAVRDELAAYPVERGPRVTYLLQTDDGGQASLVFDARRRHWFVEAVDRAA